ncbi:hypothetical protein DY000_02032249 [Brassica cretica]|uniref:Uncharacterized protein n=1 Tax=Brassica cretica TaxID=69181 RepID=A0ABQ7DYZ0_BRACR|nr:hypothetical protein DY000_02032249 [Brassica cretica]
MKTAKHQKVGEKPLLSVSTFVQAARNNVLLAVPALLYAINNYLKFTMQQSKGSGHWGSIKDGNEAAVFHHSGATAIGIPLATGAYICTIIFVTVPSMASVFNEYALKSQYDTSIYLQNLFLYGYGAIFNFLGILATVIYKGPESFDILQGHSRATVFLIMNNAAQGILSSFFFKYADTILKKYSSTVATIFTGIASAALFGHVITMNFLLGISIVFISMHQVSEASSFIVISFRADDSFINMAAGANEEATHRGESDNRKPLLPR